MTYASHSDLSDRIGDAILTDISDHDRDGTADAEVLDRALIDADSLIDGYVATRFSTPLDPVPNIVNTWAVSIALYFLHRDGAPSNVEKDYDDAIAALKDVAAGRIALPVEIGETAPEEQTGTTIASHPDPVFTTQKLRGW